MIYSYSYDEGITETVDRPICAVGSGENASNRGEIMTVNVEEKVDKTRQLSCHDNFLLDFYCPCGKFANSLANNKNQLLHFEALVVIKFT